MPHSKLYTERREKMGELTFKALFFRYYDRKIADGSVTFSKIGMSKSDFTKLCTEADFVPDRETLERVCTAMKLTEGERAELLAAAENTAK